jgi:YesN/AraC family two-component response regulator
MSYKIFTIGEHLRINLQNPPTKEIVCEKFAISDYYLRKESKKVFGLNFGEYIRQQKIKTGAKLLLSSNLLVSTIYECVGERHTASTRIHLGIIVKKLIIEVFNFNLLKS